MAEFETTCGCDNKPAHTIKDHRGTRDTARMMNLPWDDYGKWTKPMTNLEGPDEMQQFPEPERNKGECDICWAIVHLDSMALHMKWHSELPKTILNKLQDSLRVDEHVRKAQKK